jgi:hypothetical protein
MRSGLCATRRVAQPRTKAWLVARNADTGPGEELATMSRIRTVLAVASVLVVFLAAQMPASAHADRVYHGDDYGSVSADHRSIAVCDNEPDGHGVRVWFYMESGRSVGIWGISQAGRV